jgi:hypothetical protein
MKLIHVTRNAVGRVTPCAPFETPIQACGAHGVTRPTKSPRRAGKRAMMLIECLVYMGALVALLGVGYAVFYYSFENSFALRRSTDDIAKALKAGERWRADVRSAGNQVRFEGTPENRILRLRGQRGEVAYQFSTNSVLRRVGSGPWTCVLERVKSSAMESEARPSVTAWRWELELQPRSKKPVRVRPLFTFIAVPERK